jgi:hypothetical protein
MFITAGDPDLATTQELFSVIEEGGADIIELGVPFSDPLADGPVIQAASQRSLKSGTTLRKIIQLVRDIRKSSQLPIVLMTSFNPVFVYGQEAFVKDAVDAGVDGVIIPDLPPEEAGEFDALAKPKNLDMIHLLAPTSTPDEPWVCLLCFPDGCYWCAGFYRDRSGGQSKSNQAGHLTARFDRFWYFRAGAGQSRIGIFRRSDCWKRYRPHDRRDSRPCRAEGKA